MTTTDRWTAAALAAVIILFLVWNGLCARRSAAALERIADGVRRATRPNLGSAQPDRAALFTSPRTTDARPPR